MKALEAHMINLRYWFNNNGHSSSIDTTGLYDTLIVNGHSIWHEFIHGHSVEWFIDTPSDHPYNGSKGTGDWGFRIACIFNVEDDDCEKQGKAMLRMIKAQNDFWKAIDACMEDD